MKTSEKAHMILYAVKDASLAFLPFLTSLKKSWMIFFRRKKILQIFILVENVEMNA